jgi:thiamine-phosphate pyrophosphorylase
MLQLVTDRRRLSGQGEGLDCVLRQVEYAVAAKVDLVQIREPGLETAVLASLVTGAVRAARGSRTRIVVNDRLDVALACGADGVHLRRDSISAAAVRRLAPAGFLVGCSVGTVAEAEARQTHADYLIAGTVWRSASKPGVRSLLGTAGLSAIARAVRVPVLGIGGVTISRIAELTEAGAAGAAGIDLFMSAAGDPAEHGGCRAVPLEAVVAKTRQVFGAAERISTDLIRQAT